MTKSNRELDSKKERGSQPSKKAALPRRNKTGKKPHGISRMMDRATAAVSSGRFRTSIREPRIGLYGPRINQEQSIKKDAVRRKVGRTPLYDKPKSIPNAQLENRSKAKAASSGKRNPVRNKKVRNQK